MLDEFLLKELDDQLNLVLSLEVPDDVIIKRITGLFYLKLQPCSIALFFLRQLDVADFWYARFSSAGRWIHAPTGRVYNVRETATSWIPMAAWKIILLQFTFFFLNQIKTTYNPPLIEGRDDYTGQVLTKRKDDTIEVFANRLKSFHLQNQPLLDYYDHQFVISGHHELRKRKKLVHFFGDSSDQIWPEMQKTIHQRVHISLFFPSSHICCFLTDWKSGLGFSSFLTSFLVANQTRPISLEHAFWRHRSPVPLSFNWFHLAFEFQWICGDPLELGGSPFNYPAPGAHSVPGSIDRYL